ncbi:MAG TPA: SHOCT domain-containing protein [Desulfosporosinus sp.]
MMYGSGNYLRGGGHVAHGFGAGFMANGQTGWMGWLPLALHLIFMIIIIVVAVILLKRHGKKVRALRKQNDPALLILRERYAQGVIDTEDFQRRSQDLTS